MYFICTQYRKQTTSPHDKSCSSKYYIFIACCQLLVLNLSYHIGQSKQATFLSNESHIPSLQTLLCSQQCYSQTANTKVKAIKQLQLKDQSNNYYESHGGYILQSMRTMDPRLIPQLQSISRPTNNKYNCQDEQKINNTQHTY